MNNKIGPNTIARVGNGCPPGLSGALIVTKGEVFENKKAYFIKVHFISIKDSIRAFRGGNKEIEDINIIYLIPDIPKTMKYRRNPTKELLILKKLRKEELSRPTEDVQSDTANNK